MRKIDSLALKYLETKEEEDFNILYREFKKEYKPRYIADAKRFSGNSHDIEALYDDALLNAVTYYKGKSDFTNFLNVIIKNAKITYSQKVSKRKEKECLLKVDEEGRSLFDIKTSNCNVEDEIIKKFDTTIDDIIRGLRLNKKTEVFLELVSEGSTVHNAACHSGLCPKTAKRRLKKIARYYNVSDIA